MQSNGKINQNHCENGSAEITNKAKFPKRIFFIIGNEFCERFNFYGMRGLGYSEDDATTTYHAFLMSLYLSCLLGGIISDVYLGKFKTILYLSIVYMIESTTLALSSIPILNFSPCFGLLLGLTLIAVGNGGIKPCICAFGGDQFKLPEQETQLQAFFSYFYFTISLGSMISSTVTPILREDVHCFGDTDCFSLAFGVPAILMFMSIVIFLIGKPFYTHQTNSSEKLLQIIQCVTNAISTKFRSGNLNPRGQFLDCSKEKYGSELVNDIRTLSRILVLLYLYTYLYTPLPLFWALYDQQGSRWTFQADKMDGDIGFYTIKPDQMLMLSALMTIFSIPIFQTIIYPVLYKFGIRRPLQKIVIGGFCSAVAFLLSAIVQFKVESEVEKSISMLWLIPQNVITTSFNSQAHEFLLFSVLMFIDMLIFMHLAHNFERRHQKEKEENATRAN